MKVTLANKTIRDTTEITISLPERDSKISEFAEKLYIPEISADKNCVVLQCRKLSFKQERLTSIRMPPTGVLRYKII